MDGNTLKGRIKNEDTRGKLEVALVEDKIRETCLRWLIMYKGGGP